MTYASISSSLEFHKQFEKRKTQVNLKRKSLHVLATCIGTASDSSPEEFSIDFLVDVGSHLDLAYVAVVRSTSEKYNGKTMRKMLKPT